MEHLERFLVVAPPEEAVGRSFELSAAEQAHYQKMTHPRRRAEWLAWHAMLRGMLGEGVSADYDAAGRPVLVGHAGYIGVSHSRKLVALYYRPVRCGIDIEEVARDFSRTADRFISPAERLLPGAHTESFPALVWCAKEAVYKWAGIPGLDFLRDIRIVRVDPQASKIDAIVLENEPVVLKYRFFEEHCLVYTV